LNKRKAILFASALSLLLIFALVPLTIAYLSTHPERCNSKNKVEYVGRLEFFSTRTSDGIKLSGVVQYPEDTDANNGVFIILHGYTSCRRAPYIVSLANKLVKAGYTVVTFDFRAHGESGGNISTIGFSETKDAEAIISYVRENVGSKIYLIGFSMGASVAIIVGNKVDNVLGIVADSPYYRLANVIPRWLKYKYGLPELLGSTVSFWGEVLTGANGNFGPANIRNIDKPLILIVGSKDPLVTVEEAKNMAEKSPCSKLLIVKEAGHVESLYVLGLENYINNVLEITKLCN